MITFIGTFIGLKRRFWNGSFPQQLLQMTIETWRVLGEPVEPEDTLATPE